MHVVQRERSTRNSKRERAQVSRNKLIVGRHRCFNTCHSNTDATNFKKNGDRITAMRTPMSLMGWFFFFAVGLPAGNNVTEKEFATATLINEVILSLSLRKLNHMCALDIL